MENEEKKQKEMQLFNQLIQIDGSFAVAFKNDSVLMGVNIRHNRPLLYETSFDQEADSLKRKVDSMCNSILTDDKRRPYESKFLRDIKGQKWVTTQKLEYGFELDNEDRKFILKSIKNESNILCLNNNNKQQQHGGAKVDAEP